MTDTVWRRKFLLIPRKYSGQWFWGSVETRRWKKKYQVRNIGVPARTATLEDWQIEHLSKEAAKHIF